MKRDSLQAVTGFPVLLRCKIGEEDGKLGIATPVRVITTKLIVDAFRRRTLPPGLTVEEMKIINGLKLLMRAQQLKDLKAAKEGADLLMQTQIFKGSDVDKQTLKHFITYAGMQSGSLTARLASATVEKSRPVYWQPGKFRGNVWRGELGPFQPGLFCEDMGTAIAFKMLFNGIRICLRCHSVFDGKLNRDYCSVQCRESHRVARWRERKAQGKQKEGGRGKR